jgi:hypothetical protein
MTTTMMSSEHVFGEGDTQAFSAGKHAALIAAMAVELFLDSRIFLYRPIARWSTMVKETWQEHDSHPVKSADSLRALPRLFTLLRFPSVHRKSDCKTRVLKQQGLVVLTQRFVDFRASRQLTVHSLCLVYSIAFTLE